MNQSNAALTLVHRLQRWPNTKTTLVQRTVLPGNRHYIKYSQQIQDGETTMGQCWASAVNGGPALPHRRITAPCLLDTLILQIMKNNIPFTKKDLIFVSSFCCIFFQGKYLF